jgi:L-aspartate oxidase
MGFRAGATVANMEFIQFHPTALYEEGKRAGPAFLISEAVRGYGGVLRLESGEEFMTKYHALGSLAPRDVVARGIDAELKKSGAHCVWLDLTHKPSSEIRAKFPHIHETCMKRAGIDITAQPIPVVPAAHYACGGLVTDTSGRTSIDRLYALGEVAMTGVHGANRLASNSLLEAVVFSHRAVKDIAAQASEAASIPSGIPAWDDRGTFDPDEWVLIEHNSKEIRQTMWDYVGIIRSNVRLGRARRRIEHLRSEIEEYYRRTKIVEGVVALRNLATVADLIVRSALLRRESRGLHYTTDYPERDDAGWKRDTIL